jgi:multicomponent Na+:H+ antiporter subunit F
MMYAAALIAILITIFLALARALMGPTVYDRIAAMNMLGTKTILLIAVIAFLSGRHDLLDIALVYALINFIGVVAVLKLVEQGNFYTDGEVVDSKARANDQ